MSSVTIEEAQSKLPELIEHLAAGEEMVITRNQQPVARLRAEPAPKRQPRQPGSAEGMLTILQDDDEHLKDFEELGIYLTPLAARGCGLLSQMVLHVGVGGFK